MIKMGEKVFLKANSEPYEGKRCNFRFILHDMHLHFFFEVLDNDLFSPYLEDNAKIYEGDVVEVFISPNGALAHYYEIEVAPNGTVFFALITNELDEAHTISGQLLPPCFESNVEKTEKGYNVEIRLPLKLMNGFDAQSFTLNAFNIDCNSLGNVVNMQALNPTGKPRFHVPKFFVRPIL